MGSNSDSDRQLNIRYGQVQGLFWLFSAVSFVFMTPILQERGFGNAEIGILFAVRYVTQILGQLILSSVADRCYGRVALKWFAAGMTALSVVFTALFLLLPGIGILWVGFLFAGMGCTTFCISPMIDALAMQFIELGRKINYTVCRAIGSAAWAFACLGIGKMMDVFGIPELKKLVDFYVEHDDLMLDQMMNRQIDVCVDEYDTKRKWCGIGTGTIFFNTDGTRFPCPFVTPMTFSDEELAEIQKTDFKDNDTFVDEDCFNCYIHPICPFCPGANYLTQKTFKFRDKSKCRAQKLITLYVADLLAKRLLKNPNSLPKERVYNTITAIERIKKDLMPEFKEYADIM